MGQPESRQSAIRLLGSRARIGIVIPSTNTSAQPEMDALRPWGVTAHVGRMEIVDDSLVEEPGFNSVIRALRRSTDPAIKSLRDCQLDRLVVAVSPDAYWNGVAAHQDMLAHLQDTAGGVGITMSADAITEALARLGNLRRIGLISPYAPIGDEAVTAFFRETGIEVVALANLGGQSPSRISEVSWRDLRTAVETVDIPEVEAIVQVGTNVPMAAFAHAAELWTGKPVIANNTVLFWHALRACGVHDRFDGFGSLFTRC